MKVSKVNLTKTNGNKSRLAFGQLTIDGEFAVKGISVMKGKEKPFVSMPRHKNGDGEYKDTCHPTSSTLRKHISEAVLEEYMKIA